jgi:hypothetical protein
MPGACHHSTCACPLARSSRALHDVGRLCPAGTIFVYGQTGAGKTFTIDDLSHLTIHDMFVHLKSMADAQYALYVSVVELYNESLRDLISGRHGLRQDWCVRGWGWGRGGSGAVQVGRCHMWP